MNNTSGKRNKTTPCFLYILGICEAVQCQYKHEFMRCHSMCGYFNCKFFTLTPEELQSVRENVRPFTEKVAKEVDRMAYIIVTSTPTRPDHICCRFLTGKFCNYPSQYACKICPHFQEKTEHPKCTRCRIFLLSKHSYGLKCGHAFCSVCFNALEYTFEGSAPCVQCCKCGVKCQGITLR